MTKAALYARISDDREGREQGVTRQLEDARARAEALGLEVVEPPFVDNDISASTRSKKRRPAYEEMLERARRGEFSVIVAYSNSRVTRRPRELEDLIVLYERHGVVVRTVVSGDDDLSTADGRLTARLKASIDAAEAERVAERVARTNDQRAAAGMPHGRIGYGFRREGGRDVAEPTEAEIVREMTRRVLGGESLRALAKEMNERGVESRAGSPWTGPNLRRMLSRPALTGMRVHRGVIIGRAKGDAIISDDDRARLIALFANPVRRPNKEHGGQIPAHLLSSLAICGRPEPTTGDPDAICGGKMRRIAPWTDGVRKSAAAYQCGACHRVRRAQEPVDGFVTEIMLRRIEREDALDLFARRSDQDAAQDARERLAAVSARLSTAADMFAAGTIDGEQLTRITTTLRAERGELEAQLVRSMPPTVPLEAIGGGARDWWVRATLGQKRALIDALARVVILPMGSGKRTFDPESVRIDWMSEAT